MPHVVLYQPEIPPNTGNIIRLCANTNTPLHLIEPLGFNLDDKKLRRAGLDYHEFAHIKRHGCWADFINELTDTDRLFGFTTKASQCYANISFRENDYFIFGPETRGLPQSVLRELGHNHTLRIPMVKDSRSLNLANCVSIAVFEAWRQLGFTGAQN